MRNELPQLTGSQKQIAWANSIRAKALDTVSDFYLQVQSQRAANPAVADAFKVVFERIFGTTSARYWIDHRNAFDGLAWWRSETAAELRK